MEMIVLCAITFKSQQATAAMYLMVEALEQVQNHHHHYRHHHHHHHRHRHRHRHRHHRHHRHHHNHIIIRLRGTVDWIWSLQRKERGGGGWHCFDFGLLFGKEPTFHRWAHFPFTLNFTFTFQVELTPEQKALFPELTDLRQQIENLQVKNYRCCCCCYFSEIYFRHLSSYDILLESFSKDPCCHFQIFSIPNSQFQI